MKIFNYYFTILLFATITFFTACSEEIQMEEITQMETATELEQAKRLTKDIEVYTENRKGLAIITVQANEQKALDEVTAESFILSPLFEIPQAAGNETNSEEEGVFVGENDSNVPEVDYIFKIVQEDEEAIGYQLHFKETDSRAWWKHKKTIKTSYNCAMVTTTSGKIKTKYYDRSCSSCSWEHSFTGKANDGGYSWACKDDYEKKIKIYYDQWQLSYGYTYILYNN